MKKTLKLIILIIIVLILVIAGFLVYTKIIKNDKEITSEKIILQINKKFFNNSLEIQQNFMGWIMENDQRICLSDGKSLFNSNISEGDIIENNKRLSDWFTDQGFVKNEKNNYEIKDEFRDSTVGFEKDNIKCLIDWYIDSHSQIISCADVTEKDKQNHNKFYNIVNENKKNNSSLVCVEKQNDEFSRGSISFWRGGAEWYAKKENNEWKLLLRTQDYLQCSFAEQFPIGFLKTDYCYPNKK